MTQNKTVPMKLDTTIVILMKFSSQDVAKMTTPGEVCDENFVKMTTFPFQWVSRHRRNIVGTTLIYRDPAS